MQEKEPAQADLKEQLEPAAGGHRGIPFMCFLEVPQLFHALWQGVIPPYSHRAAPSAVPIFPLRCVGMLSNWGTSTVWNYLPANVRSGDVLACFCAHGCAGCSGSARERGFAQGSPSTWPACSHTSFPHPPPHSPSCLFSCLFPCSFDSLLLETLLHIS